VAARRTTSWWTTRRAVTTKTTGQTRRINWADVGQAERESDVVSDQGLNLANWAMRGPDYTPKSSPAKDASVPCANLRTSLLSSTRQKGQETDLKKASWMPADNSGKCNLAVMQEADEPYS